ncbi:hypothetical protein BVG79_00392 [Ketogulonicigenium robustum]|uniref:Uncharacterized protein n=1 Tax=Ketogulonicigenium robustum TaxID=92947 RepID=A0A1W6NWW1_9RHOB|nr:hypothetical protein [Ketogulonicigenium robustum]ARO13748.1 hypothetical protein BVG79_00392 [Ketogulonicigenium robustum]
MVEKRLEWARWAEVIAGVAVLGMAAWWLRSSYGLSRIPGWAGLALGAVLIWIGIQRLRFGAQRGGLGVVQLDERRLTYMGPLTGGMIDLDDLARLDFDGTGRPPHWVLTGRNGTLLAIPINAEGGERLFDAFSALPGLSSARLSGIVMKKERQRVLIWKE